MDVSIIIVNYNVKHFLEQCLSSVFRSVQGLETEVFVVDNNSGDGSVAMVSEKFPGVKLIINSENRGFGAANNQALAEACGNYILFLNPDTVIDEDTIHLMVQFMENTPDAGAAGVKMIDGKGRFLKESKRALPTPEVSFYKIFGLSALFRKSKRFNQYHLSHLSKDKINKIDIVSGAFFFTRKKILDKTGGFDEKFFMYGEDVDLSYRIKKAGYTNYYLPEPSIIHFKGESTKKGNADYLRHFYKAMIIFSGKHFKGRKLGTINFLVKLAILFRALISFIYNIGRKLLLPLIDFSMCFIMLNLVLGFWENYRFGLAYDYPPLMRTVFIPVYTLIWILTLFAWKAYQEPVRFSTNIKGLLTGTVIILLVYALLPAELRFSRAIILIGSVMNLILVSFLRILLGLKGIIRVTGIAGKPKRIAIISAEESYSTIIGILTKSEIKFTLAGRISPKPEDHGPHVLGHARQLKEIIRLNTLDEVIFSSSDLGAGEIIEIMKSLSSLTVSKKIARTDSEFVIGSNSRKKQGEIYSLKV